MWGSIWKSPCHNLFITYIRKFVLFLQPTLQSIPYNWPNCDCYCLVSNLTSSWQANYKHVLAGAPGVRLLWLWSTLHSDLFSILGVKPNFVSPVWGIKKRENAIIPFRRYINLTFVIYPTQTKFGLHTLGNLSSVISERRKRPTHAQFLAS